MTPCSATAAMQSSQWTGCANCSAKAVFNAARFQSTLASRSVTSATRGGQKRNSSRAAVNGATALPIQRVCDAIAMPSAETVAPNSAASPAAAINERDQSRLRIKRELLVERVRRRGRQVRCAQSTIGNDRRRRRRRRLRERPRQGDAGSDARDHVDATRDAAGSQPESRSRNAPLRRLTRTEATLPARHACHSPQATALPLAKQSSSSRRGPPTRRRRASERHGRHQPQGSGGRGRSARARSRGLSVAASRNCRRPEPQVVRRTTRTRIHSGSERHRIQIEYRNGRSTANSALAPTRQAPAAERDDVGGHGGLRRDDRRQVFGEPVGDAPPGRRIQVLRRRAPPALGREPHQLMSLRDHEAQGASRTRCEIAAASCRPPRSAPSSARWSSVGAAASDSRSAAARSPRQMARTPPMAT